MSKLILGILVVVVVAMLLRSSPVIGQEIEDIEQYNIPKLEQAVEIKRHISTPKEAYYAFIKKVRPAISNKEMRDIFRAIEYYTPRYFGINGKFEEGLIWMLSIIAQESSFRNVNGDEGKSIGYGQIQIPTCNEARKYNGIKKQMNLIARWDNIHCSSAELNRLNEIFGNFEHAIMAYNCGVRCVEYWIRKDLIKTKKKNYFNKVDRRRQKLLKTIQEYKDNAKM